MLSRRDFFRIAGVTALPAAAAPQERPDNVLFILIDDMGVKDLGCYGNAVFETPNIDRLAREGMRFTNAYAACCVCSPSRASILTGKYPARLQLTDWIPGRRQWPAAKLLTPQFRQELPHQEITLAEMLKPRGYAAASIGKWHLGDQGFLPDSQGFDRNVAGTRRGSPQSYFGPFDLPGLKGGAATDYLADALATETIGFIEQNRTRPWVIYLPHFSVHLPLQASKRWIAYYEEKRKPGAPEFDATYAAMVHQMDLAVGRVLDALDRMKLAGNTLVMLTSDNGGLRYEGGRKQPVTDNAPWRAGKGHLYEGGIREPLLVRWPGRIRPGSTSDAPVSGIDYLPTVREAAAVREPLPHGVDGVSLMPVLRGTGTLRPRPLFWHYPHYSNQGGVPSSAVREGDWKLLEFLEDGRIELFHLGRDPGERTNLARREAKVAARLHRLLDTWRKSVNAAMPRPNPAYDPARAGQGLTGAEPPTPPA
ncbi:MAG: sulfatase [Acidobacteria bacterium]|nr:sulfatase [Acidobacteriota bacterium]MBI3279360.1 sulfatase [Acidobacteriota bacterium]